LAVFVYCVKRVPFSSATSLICPPGCLSVCMAVSLPQVSRFCRTLHPVRPHTARAATVSPVDDNVKCFVRGSFFTDRFLRSLAGALAAVVACHVGPAGARPPCFQYTHWSAYFPASETGAQFVVRDNGEGNAMRVVCVSVCHACTVCKAVRVRPLFSYRY